MQAAEEFVRREELLLGAFSVHNLRPLVLSQQRNPRLHREWLLLLLPPPSTLALCFYTTVYAL